MVFTVADAEIAGLPAEVAVMVDVLVPLPFVGIDTITQTLTVAPGDTSGVAGAAVVQVES
jgi:hypothetical protein